MLGVESCLHHHMEGQQRLSGGLCHAGSKHQQVEWVGKQHETEQTVYRISQTTTNNGFSLEALQAATPDNPLPHGDALIAIKKLKQKKMMEEEKIILKGLGSLIYV